MGSDAVSYQGLTLSPILFVTAIQIFTDGVFFFVICWEIRLEVLGGGEDGKVRFRTGERKEHVVLNNFRVQ